MPYQKNNGPASGRSDARPQNGIPHHPIVLSTVHLTFIRHQGGVPNRFRHLRQPCYGADPTTVAA